MDTEAMTTLTQAEPIVNPSPAPDFIVQPLDPSQTDWTYFDPNQDLDRDAVADAWTADDDEPTGPDAADRQWAAAHLNDDDGRDFDSEADDAAAIEDHERGLIFA
jgi:hypothetical protein